MNSITEDLRLDMDGAYTDRFLLRMIELLKRAIKVLLIALLIALLITMETMFGRSNQNILGKVGTITNDIKFLYSTVSLTHVFHPVELFYQPPNCFIEFSLTPYINGNTIN